jgi:uncharacterized protein
VPPIASASQPTDVPIEPRAGSGVDETTASIPMAPIAPGSQPTDVSIESRAESDVREPAAPVSAPPAPDPRCPPVVVAMALCERMVHVDGGRTPPDLTLASETDGTGIRVGRDLAEFVAPAAGVRLDVVAAPNPAEAVRRLRAGGDVKLATVPSDGGQALLVKAAREDAGAGKPAPPLRVIVPLYAEEIFFIARADAPFTYVHEIRDAKINAGPPGSATAEAVGAVYRRMFGKPLTGHQTSALPHEDALVKLATDKSIDVVAVVAAQPVSLLANMTSEAPRYIKLLKLDRDHPASRAALRAYESATVRAASYPALLAEDVPALGVRVYLVTLDFRDHATESSLIRFARSLCQNLANLRAKGHPKWREVELNLTPLADGLDYYQPTSSELRACKR